MRTVAEAASMIRTAAPKDPNNPDNSKEPENSKKDIQKFLLDEAEEEDEDNPDDFEN